MDYRYVLFFIVTLSYKPNSISAARECILIYVILIEEISDDGIWFLAHSPPLITKEPPTGELLFQVVSRQSENNKPFLIECEAEGEPVPT